MNEKASVSKELNAKHVKILLGLLKLPENRECADCRSKAPSWASINLGVFICMQCSGIHRSLGVHISKVRSTTLDTWLPEQVAFMQAMGNQKAKSYWEADLPKQFYRSPIEQFIYAKYVNKRWASTTSPQPMPEICVETCVSTTRKEIPKKARRYSLDEEFFKAVPKHIAPPPMHSRGESLDLMDMDAFVSAPPLSSFEGCSSSKHVDATTDLFTLLYESEETHDRTVVPPSRWATFECEESTGGLFYSEDCFTPICIAAHEEK